MTATNREGLALILYSTILFARIAPLHPSKPSASNPKGSDLDFLPRFAAICSAVEVSDSWASSGLFVISRS
jgi:hypothetical protein